MCILWQHKIISTQSTTASAAIRKDKVYIICWFERFGTSSISYVNVCWSLVDLLMFIWEMLPEPTWQTSVRSHQPGIWFIIHRSVHRKSRGGRISRGGGLYWEKIAFLVKSWTKYPTRIPHTERLWSDTPPPRRQSFGMDEADAWRMDQAAGWCGEPIKFEKRINIWPSHVVGRWQHQS